MFRLRKRIEEPAPSATQRVAQIPERLRLYVIGDVHGRADLLLRMRDLVQEDIGRQPVPQSTIILLGDYVDRGPSSMQVVELLASGTLFQHRVIALRGNHEDMLLGFAQDQRGALLWRHNGGVETLHSYGVDVQAFRIGQAVRETGQSFRARLPAAHRDFLAGLPTSCEIGDYYFCHAGVRPGVPLTAQSEADLLWIRDEFLASQADFGKIVVHGHTPVVQPQILPNRINVDTGAYISNRLTCLVLEGETYRFLFAESTRHPALRR
jgi:serine/threonine protein phosphatase 1